MGCFGTLRVREPFWVDSRWRIAAEADRDFGLQIDETRRLEDRVVGGGQKNEIRKMALVGAEFFNWLMKRL